MHYHELRAWMIPEVELPRRRERPIRRAPEPAAQLRVRLGGSLVRIGRWVGGEGIVAHQG